MAASAAELGEATGAWQVEARARAMGMDELPPADEMQRLVELAADVCGAPVGLFSLLDERWQTVMASVGMQATRMPAEQAMCLHAVQMGELMVVEDTMKDVRFLGHPMVTGDPEIRFYAGLPIWRGNGRKGQERAMGTLCVVDMRPRSLTETQMRALRVLGMLFQTRLELMAEHRRLEGALAARDRADARLRANQTLFHAFLENGPLLTYMKDGAGRYVFYNGRVAERYRISCTEWLGRDDAELFGEEESAEVRAHDREAMGTRGVVMSEDVLVEGGREVVWRSYRFRCEDEDGQEMVAGMSMEVTEQRRQMEELRSARHQLEQLQTTDALTGLLTKQVFDERLLGLWEEARTNRSTLSLLILDLDELSHRNRRMGQEAGDEVLRRVAEVLQRTVAESDAAARYSGAEFAVLMPETSADEARAMAERFQRELRKEDWGLLPVTVSVGIATTQHAVRGARQLFCFADDAMYRAKDLGRNRVVLYTPR